MRDVTRCTRRAVRRGAAALEREIVRLGRARREDDALRRRADARGDLRARGLDERARAAAGACCDDGLRELAARQSLIAAPTAGSSGAVAA